MRGPPGLQGPGGLKGDTRLQDTKGDKVIKETFGLVERLHWLPI